MSTDPMRFKALPDTIDIDGLLFDKDLGHVIEYDQNLCIYLFRNDPHDSLALFVDVCARSVSLMQQRGDDWELIGEALYLWPVTMESDIRRLALCTRGWAMVPHPGWF